MDDKNSTLKSLLKIALEVIKQEQLSKPNTEESERLDPCCLIEDRNILGILPIEFVSRILSGNSPQGVLLTTGQMIFVIGINSVSVDIAKDVWIDFSIAKNEDNFVPPQIVSPESFYSKQNCFFSSSKSQRNVTIKLSSIAAVFEAEMIADEEE